MELPDNRPYLTILSSNLGGNCLARALVFAQCLKSNFRVRIVGPLKKGKKIWEVADPGPEIEIVPAKFFRLPLYLFTAISIIRKVKGEHIIACKPLASSFGIGLIMKYFWGKKLILDIDDDELALLSEGKSFSRKYFHLNPDKYLYSLLLHKLIKKADGITTAGVSLQAKFGGLIIPHVREAEFFELREKKEELKNRLGISKENFVIGYIGTFRRHKGFERIVEALDILQDSSIIFLYTAKQDHLPPRDYIKRIPEFPFTKLPEILGACDFAVFPLVESRISDGQLPAKIVDAMFMGVPFIASKTKNIEALVKDKDSLFPQNASSEHLAEKISYFKNNPGIRQEKSRRAREIAQSELTLESAVKKLLSLL